MPISPDDALARLQEGNQRFQRDPRGENWTFTGPDLEELTEGQRPFAAVLGCSDSRVPVEVVFGQGPGQLFVIRVAGNVAASTQVGSIEFAVGVLGVRLVLVLGHAECGAVKAAIDGDDSGLPPHLHQLVHRVADALPQSIRAEHDPATRLDRAVRANVAATLEAIRSESDLIRDRVASGDIRLVGGVYHLGSGAVEWLEG